MSPTVAAAGRMRVFGSVRSRDVRSIAAPVLDVHAPQGAELIHEGEVAGTFFVIREGRAELWREQSKLGSLGPGDCFGEIEPLGAQPQRFSVIAGSPMRLLAFSAFGIAALCATIPGSRERILEFLPSSGDSRPAASLLERSRVEYGDRPVVGGDPAKLAHQPERTRDGLARRAGPPRELVLGQR